MRVREGLEETLGDRMSNFDLLTRSAFVERLCDCWYTLVYGQV